MNNEEQHNRAHAQEMDDPHRLEAAEQRGQLGELDRLPQHQAGDHDQDADQQNADVEQALDRVVVHGIIMREPEM